MLKNKLKLLIMTAVTLLPTLFGVVLWQKLPAKMPIHFGPDGTADGFAGKGLAVFGIPIFLAVLFWVCIIAESLDKKNKDQNGKVINLVLWIVPIISLTVNSVIYCVALGTDINVTVIMSLMLGAMFIFTGNYLPKCKQNRTIGIKIKWTLESEENWNKTHRFAGKLWVAAGVLCFVLPFIPTAAMIYLFFGIILIAGLMPFIYSYLNR